MLHPVAARAPVPQRIAEVSGIRPVTLLVASGIALIAAILMITGIAANQLRRHAILAAEGEIAGIDAALAEASGRSFAAVDARLSAVAANLGDTAATSSTSRLRAALDREPQLLGLALIAADGRLIAQVGAWSRGAGSGYDFAAALRHLSAAATAIAASPGDRSHIALLRRLVGPGASLTGAVAGLVPAADFASLFAAIPLAPDSTVALLQSDGTPLIVYPESSSAWHERGDPDERPAATVGSDATIVRPVEEAGGRWRIEALRALPGYPAVVRVRRSADRVLAEWAHQGLWFGGFALVLSVAIAIMVYLIARQFGAHAALAALRAERIEADKIESERARLAAEAELLKKERLSVLGQLTATVAHELRNPLSTIRNTLFVLRELASGAPQQFDRPLARVEHSIDRCDRIVADLLEYTRQRELHCDNVRFDRWLAALLAEQPLDPAVVLTLELRAGTAEVSIDRDRIRRVVINLIDNAVQALGEMTHDRARQLTVRTAVVPGDQLELVVEDSGRGIAPEVLDRIFEPLFSTKSYRTGLGLPTAKQIVNQHRGTIAVDSRRRHGTRVKVRLPLPRRTLSDVRVAA